jgi:hypothetical protein
VVLNHILYSSNTDTIWATERISYVTSIKTKFEVVEATRPYRQRAHSSSKMTSINWCTSGINTSMYRAIMWKSDFSVNYNPECVTYRFYVQSGINTFIQQLSDSPL